MIIQSHNSTAYTLDFSVSFFPTFSKWNILRKCAQYLPFVRNRITALTQNQDWTLAEQLKQGVDMLDIYVSRATDGRFYCSHTFATIPFITALVQIAIYVGASSQRTLQIVLRPDFENRETVRGYEQDIWALISRIVPNKTVTWYYEALETSPAWPNVRPFSDLSLDWYNTNDIDAFLRRFSATEYDASKTTAGLQCILTPQVDGDSVLCTTVRTKARLLNRLMCAFFKELPREKCPHIVSFDFISRAELALKLEGQEEPAERAFVRTVSEDTSYQVEDI